MRLYGNDSGQWTHEILLRLFSLTIVFSYCHCRYQRGMGGRYEYERICRIRFAISRRRSKRFETYGLSISLLLTNIVNLQEVIYHTWIFYVRHIRKYNPCHSTVYSVMDLFSFERLFVVYDVIIIEYSVFLYHLLLSDIYDILNMSCEKSRLDSTYCIHLQSDHSHLQYSA
jgi:hypothetical protein